MSVPSRAGDCRVPEVSVPPEPFSVPLLSRFAAAPVLLLLTLALFPLPGRGIVTAPTLQGPPVAPDSLQQAVDQLFAPWHRPDTPGAAVLIMQDGAVLHARGYGMANLEHGIPMRSSTVLDVASVSKQFAAFSLALLEAEGSVDLEDPVRSHLPELPPWGDEVTLRHLLHHTGGVRDWPGTLGMAGWDYQDVISYEQILRMARHQEELNFQPGSEYAYSNTGYNLLAEVVSRIGGRSFREWTEERIFQPLGMTRTHFQDDHTEVIPDRADSYAPAAGGGYRRIPNNLTALGSSSLHSTVEDLARWIANFEAPVVGSPEVHQAMNRRGVLNGGDTIAYALGQSLTEYRGILRVSHTGSWAGFRSVLHRYPEEGFAVVILANTADMNPAALAEAIAGIFLVERLSPPASVTEDLGGRSGEEGAWPETWRPDGEELREYTGAYLGGELDATYRLQVEDGVLVGHHFRLGRRVFLPLAPDRFQAQGFGEVRFFRDEEDRISGFTANSIRIRNLRFVRLH